MLGRNKDKNEKEPQEVKITWADNQHRRAMLYSSLFQVAGQVTQISLSTGKPVDEVVSTYTKAFELLDEWYRGTPFKEELQKVLDMLYPDPASYEPGETLV